MITCTCISEAEMKIEHKKRMYDCSYMHFWGEDGGSGGGSGGGSAGSGGSSSVGGGGGSGGSSGSGGSGGGGSGGAAGGAAGQSGGRMKITHTWGLRRDMSRAPTAAAYIQYAPSQFSCFLILL